MPGSVTIVRSPPGSTKHMQPPLSRSSNRGASSPRSRSSRSTNPAKMPHPTGANSSYGAPSCRSTFAALNAQPPTTARDSSTTIPSPDRGRRATWHSMSTMMAPTASTAFPSPIVISFSFGLRTIIARKTRKSKLRRVFRAMMRCGERKRERPRQIRRGRPFNQRMRPYTSRFLNASGTSLYPLDFTAPMIRPMTSQVMPTAYVAHSKPVNT